MLRQYLYEVEFNIEDFELWCYPDELTSVDAEFLPTFIRFKMNPSICLEINEEEFLDQVNCGQKITKNSSVFCLNEDQVKENVDASIIVCKLKSPGNEVIVGSYRLPQLHNSFYLLMEQFDNHAANEDVDSDCRTKLQPCTDIVNELIQLVNQKGQSSGSLHYSLRLSCFGSAMRCDQTKKKVLGENEKKEDLCLRSSVPCSSESNSKEPDYDEYSGEVNGNQLIVRVYKSYPHLVTRDCDSNANTNKKQHNVNLSPVYACNQQVDVKKDSCDRSKSIKCYCGPGSMTTDLQRQTSCNGKSFKNSCRLPVIRGNLKYPGRIVGNAGDLISFDIFQCCAEANLNNNFKKKPQSQRNTCLQADAINLPKSVNFCKRGCLDDKNDIFILKIGSKKNACTGQRNEIELEMRTPKGSENRISKMETCEVQVNEKDFETNEDKKKIETVPSTRSGFVKKRK